jgi:hypothetical protein
MTSALFSLLFLAEGWWDGENVNSETPLRAVCKVESDKFPPLLLLAYCRRFDPSSVFILLRSLNRLEGKGHIMDRRTDMWPLFEH